MSRNREFEMYGICAGCQYNDETCCMCDRCIDANRFVAKATPINSTEKYPNGIPQHAIRAKLNDGKLSQEDFDIILQDWLKRIEGVLGQKAGEYAQGGDRLFNFRLAAQINNQTMPQALWGMATKHLVSVMDLVEGRLEPTPAIVNEKCTDLVNYIILLSATLLEKRFK